MHHIVGINFQWGGLIHTYPSIGFSYWSKVLTRSFALIEKEVWGDSNLYSKNLDSIPITKPTLRPQPIDGMRSYQNRHWKLGHRSAIRWNYLGLFKDYGLNHILFRVKTFLFFKIEAVIFSICLKKMFENRCWKSQLSILENKKVSFIKNALSQNLH